MKASIPLYTVNFIVISVSPLKTQEPSYREIFFTYSQLFSFHTELAANSNREKNHIQNLHPFLFSIILKKGGNPVNLLKLFKQGGSAKTQALLQSECNQKNCFSDTTT